MSAVPTVIRVLLVRNRLLVREALAAMLKMQPDIRIPAHVGSIGDALRMIGLIMPIDCAVVEFESGSNESFFADLTALRKSTRILLIGDIMQPQELETLRPIAAGILSNSSSSGALIDAIRGISSGQTWEDLPHLNGSAMLAHTRQSPTFTARQQMVLHLVWEGLSNKECAHAMKVSPSSIKCTIQQLFVKAKAPSRSQLVRYAMENSRLDSSKALSVEVPDEHLPVIIEALERRAAAKRDERPNLEPAETLKRKPPVSERSDKRAARKSG
jgi:two-component system, NarL family, response regulator DesR